MGGNVVAELALDWGAGIAAKDDSGKIGKTGEVNSEITCVYRKAERILQHSHKPRGKGKRLKLTDVIFLFSLSWDLPDQLMRIDADRIDDIKKMKDRILEL